MSQVLLAAFLFLLIFAALTDLVLLLRPSALSGALSPAFALFVALESVLLNCLSFFHAVEFSWLLGVHLALLILWAGFAIFQGRLFRLIRRYRLLFRNLCQTRSVQLLVPLLVLLTMTATLYPPNTYDVLTYHMARVVHWLQNESIAYYPTAIDRQNVMGPGAEYLLLLLQSLSSSDHLANLVQLSAFIVLIISVLHLLRLFKGRGRSAGWIMILSVTAPIAIMEASGAKNDLVAAVMTLAVLFSGMRLLLGQVSRMRMQEYGLTGICIAGAFLVKPTALLAAGPVLAIGICRQLPGIFSSSVAKRMMTGAGLALLAVIIIAGPDIVRKYQSHMSRHEVYPLFSEYTADRFWNPLRHFAHNTPFPEITVSLVRKFGYYGSLITKDIFNPHEDMVGNPFQASAALLAAGMSLLAWLALLCRPNHAYLLSLSLSPVLAWFIFGIIIKDQGWLTRLQMPLFYILPLSFVYLQYLAAKNKFFVFFLEKVLCCSAFFSLAYALLVATHVSPRPLVLSHFWGESPSRIGAYYANAPALKTDHNVFLQHVKEQGCMRVGLILGPDSVDYPLTWRSMQSGVQVRHVREFLYDKPGLPVWRFREEDSDWPCMIYASYGVVEHVPNRGKQYLSAGDYHTYVRNLKWEFDQSSQSLLNLGVDNQDKKIIPMNEAEIKADLQVLTVESQGDDPQLLLPVFLNGTARSAVLKLTIDSPVNTEAQLFYITRDMESYTEQTSLQKKITMGINVLYFFLPTDEMIGAVRLDPGKAPGTYRLAELEVRAISRRVSDLDDVIK